MPSIFSIYRWATFAFFLLSNALVCSIAAWNMSFVAASSRTGMVDAFLIFVGAFGIVVILPLIAVELLRRNAVSGRVWFELAWVGLFWLLYFAGAVAATAVLPNGLCDAPNFALNKDPCNSSRAVIAFTWIPTAILLVYFFILAVFAIIHSKDDDKIWHASVGAYTWFETKQCIRSAPSTPVMSRFTKSKPPSFAVPKPKRPPPIFVQHRAGLSSNYEIEHFPDPGSLEEQPLPPPVVPAKPPVDILALYPQQVQSSLNVTRDTKQTLPMHVYRTADAGANGASEPPPVRDWPKQIGEERRPSRRERAAAAAASSSSVNVAAAKNEQPKTSQPQPQLRPLMLGRSNSNGESNAVYPRRADKGKGRMSDEQLVQEQMALERTNTKTSVRSYSSQKPPSQPLPPVPQTQTTAEDKRSRRPSGPRTRSSSGEKHRPPPLDLSKSLPTSSRR